MKVLPAMKTRCVAAAASSAVLALLANSALAEPARIFETASSWYVIDHGRFVYSLFQPPGADSAGDEIFIRARTAALSSLRRLGLSPVATGVESPCKSQAATDVTGREGVAYVCSLAFSASSPQVADSSGPPSGPAPPPATTRAPAPSAPALARASFTPPAPSGSAGAPTTRPPVPNTPASGGADAASADDLNLKIMANLQAATAKDKANKDAYEAAVKAYEDEKKARELAYAAQLKDHEKAVAAVEQKRAQDLAAWQAQVDACKAGDHTKCAPP